MPGVDFRVLRREVAMREVLSRLGFEPVRRCGEQWRGPCPVHGSRGSGSRAFSVNVSSGRYCCHKCGSHGNVLELWAAVRKLPLYEAALDLCRVLGRDVPWLRNRRRAADRGGQNAVAPAPLHAGPARSRTEKRHRYLGGPKDVTDTQIVST